MTILNDFRHKSRPKILNAHKSTLICNLLHCTCLTSALFQLYNRYHSEPSPLPMVPCTKYVVSSPATHALDHAKVLRVIERVGGWGRDYKVPILARPFCFVTSQNRQKTSLRISSILWSPIHFSIRSMAEHTVCYAWHKRVSLSLILKVHTH